MFNNIAPSYDLSQSSAELQHRSLLALADDAARAAVADGPPRRSSILHRHRRPGPRLRSGGGGQAGALSGPISATRC